MRPQALMGRILNQVMARRAMMERKSNLAFVMGAAALLTACGEATEEAPPSPVNDIDPQVARALNDPLMIDPDLSHRNEANAAITIGYDHALPSFKANEATASRAREAARLELLEEGPLADLPIPQSPAGLVNLAQVWDVPGVLAALKLPEECQSDIAGDFAFAADMPPGAGIMPHGMVRVAAASNSSACAMRLVRYTTPAPIEDVLQYHFNTADRARIDPVYFEAPERIVKGERRGKNIEVHARLGSGNLTEVDLVYWARR